MNRNLMNPTTFNLQKHKFFLEEKISIMDEHNKFYQNMVESMRKYENDTRKEFNSCNLSSYSNVLNSMVFNLVESSEKLKKQIEFNKMQLTSFKELLSKKIKFPKQLNINNIQNNSSFTSRISIENNQYTMKIGNIPNPFNNNSMSYTKNNSSNPKIVNFHCIDIPNSKILPQFHNSTSNINFPSSSKLGGDSIKMEFTESDEELINNRTSYQFIRKIFTGGFATVYHCLKDKKNYALKIMIKSKEKTNQIGNDLELDILRQVKHPNIIKMIDYIDKHNILVLEYVETNLKQLFIGDEVHKQLLENEDIIFLIIIQIIKGLEQLAKESFCHRDLKLENILISKEDYQIKLIDFNTSKYVRENEIENTYISSGYNAENEQIQSLNVKEQIYHSDEIYNKDMYSLGVLLISLCNRKEPQEHVDRIFFKDSLDSMVNPNMHLDLIEILFKHDQTIMKLVKSDIFKKKCFPFEKEIEEIKKEYKTRNEELIDPYSVLLKKRIDEILKKKSEESDFYFIY